MQRAILLIRNPFDAIWSEYQRVFTRSHVQGIVREKFLVSGWHKDALRKTEWYRKLWLEEYNGIFTHLKPENILIIRYEDLKDTHTRIAVLRLITNFLKLNEEPESTERLQCAFQLAEQGKVHRAVNDSEYMSKEEVYTEEIVCKMWRNLAAVSIPFGYGIWGNFSCSDVNKAVDKVQSTRTDFSNSKSTEISGRVHYQVNRIERSMSPDSVIDSLITTHFESNRSWIISHVEEELSLTLSHEQCKIKFGERHFLTGDQRRSPALLYTFPGSGNTWCRLLIESATGIHSGSWFNDGALKKIMPGEKYCNHEVSVVKAHPNWQRFDDIHYHKHRNKKCEEGNVTFNKAILLIRNPYDAIWSEHQRKVCENHAKGILREKFNRKRWEDEANILSSLYRTMWQIEYKGVFTHFKQENILIIRYEDLKNTHTSVPALRLITNFLKLNEEPESTERLQCAFQMADVEKVHRAVNQSEYMSKEEVYTEEIVCKMWRNLAAVSIPIGYRIWGNFSCE
eukprot:CAMPEP_0182437060 /NCGR_PEP_ID=MMETSP1167-20130531/84791_1 /TAXON_ID=2988 /ORGANISM="Mallomonas Sp, Strain CCMP3275" /LENGTH=509 /DNA_ID=CAMNT_0024629847 /DNA_START=245 /DNA_END=1774 /DNA_ORIENTATION=-